MKTRTMKVKKENKPCNRNENGCGWKIDENLMSACTCTGKRARLVTRGA